ncbi:MarR family transcriptional regulator [Bombilactobacillus folatiphilus]|uniref:MarR family transcriptional regulator n=1 Tax=Bombilactobacillus folatiphilus TaxID=2923362 RepID=A0ABY4PA96_9LACO|nr:MarR family transcriptional regulator [Bombilactobacillus folatiphilus]UQS82571.1 MarR family transcriptional regulator [Bombilactobacillus folatiphilus]
MNDNFANNLYQQMVQLNDFFNQPQNDLLLLKHVKIELDQRLFPLFSTIARKQPISVGQLAQLMGIPHSTISRRLDRLEQQNLISAVQNNDLRSRTVQLSDKGVTLDKQLSASRVQLLNQALRSLTIEQQNQILQAIKCLNQLLSQ